MATVRIALANRRAPATPDESEEPLYAPGTERRGAHVVFHPHFHEAEPGGYAPARFADPLNTCHEKAMLCRAAENACDFASVHCASAGSPTTSAVVRPDGTVLAWQPCGEEGLLPADVDTDAATRLLAMRCRSA